MKQLRGSLILLIASVIWGSTFVAQSKGMDYIGPHTYNAARFLLGFIVLTPVALFTLKKDKNNKENFNDYVKKSVITGLIIGFPEILASALQQIGIMGTTTGKAGFLTALYIVFVPLMGLFLKKKVNLLTWFAVGLALVGFYFLSIHEGFTINGYDICLVGCAIAFSIQILCVDILAADCNPVVVSQMMFLTCSIVSIVLAFLSETPTVQSLIDCAVPILYAGVLSCGIAYTFQMIGQRDTDPAIASLIMSLESVFAAVFGFLILHDTLSFREIMGCLFIFSAVILSQLPDSIFKSKK